MGIGQKHTGVVFAIMFSSYVVTPDGLSSVLPFANGLFSATSRKLGNYGSQNPFPTGLRLDSEFTGGLASREMERLWSPGQQQTQRDLCPPCAGSWHLQHLPLIPTLLAKVFIQLCLKYNK